MSDFGSYLSGELITGLQTTIVLFLASAITGNLLALPVALGRISTRKWIRYPVIGFMLSFRGTPLLVQLYIFYFGVGQVLATVPAIRYSPLWPLLRSANGYAYVVLSLNTAAYCAEIWRGAILGLPIGQSEAGRSLGLSKQRITVSILLPQAFRLALPAIGGQNILLLKGTALTAAITVFETMATANLVRAQTFRTYEPLLAAALVYFVLASIITSGFKYMETRLASRY
ncbi:MULTISPECIES: ABC transporter permease subunit [Rhizobium/Agrobacterium group]|uniref:ABC transporter membrane spanning protein n=2 Tax=Rhizobium/Agrobacterium group TaxID=227290 RepID=B9K5A4_ALLAM|nr:MULTISPECIES: ABC transporter permease subunit [Rhizobium/Agrobacterium group]ACM40052.1 ABC transporter membrane spanning protein [Allorhizobium ampelinum S4]MCF1448171.1 ABC transporter permease subunit [Allorhizobium ampelinum]MCF1493712.1 ABC transporter permease subunit [Allorhizobium ampelinum]MUO28473.1 ABC transporter permease subunit [Agrobacterium vitis]MUO41355.1 ABC transporter permease subunit [Agrobacterium vitis]